MKNVSPYTTRRGALKTLAAAIVGIGVARIAAAYRGALPHLTDANPAAGSLAYTDDARTVDSRKFPRRAATERCANCRYLDLAGAEGGFAPCRLYPGNAVSVNGWCAGYAQRKTA